MTRDRSADLGRDRGWKADLRQNILGVLRRVGAPVLLTDLQACLPDSSRRAIALEPESLLTELHTLVEAGRVDRIDNGGTGPASFVVRPPKRLTGLMVAGPGARRTSCRRYESCLAAAAQSDADAHCPAGSCFVPPQPLEAFALATVGRGASPIAAFGDHEMAGVA